MPLAALAGQEDLAVAFAAPGFVLFVGVFGAAVANNSFFK
jgi:hypothetical protein